MNNSTPRDPKQERATGFRVSDGPVVRHGKVEGVGAGVDFGELPRVSGGPILFSIPRDPRTLFTYWNIDWSTVFAKNEPVDREVYLRVLKSDGTQESESLIEPMLGTCYAPVAQPREDYRVEIGYYQPVGAWRSVAVSEAVTMPPDAPSANMNIDVATVPLHLSFQRMVDLFRASNGDALASIISRLQSRALTEEERQCLTPEEWEILRAMNFSLSEVDAARRALMDRAGNDLLRKQTEKVLGFGSTSPRQGFGGSSWGPSSA